MKVAALFGSSVAAVGRQQDVVSLRLRGQVLPTMQRLPVPHAMQTTRQLVVPCATIRPFVGTVAQESDAQTSLAMEKAAQKWFEAELEEDPPIDDIVADDCIFTDKMNGWVFRGRDAIKQRMVDFNTAYPDFELSVLDVMLNAKGRSAACLWAGTGTNLGPIGDTGPTGVRNRQSGVHVFTFGDDGNIINVVAFREKITEEQKFIY